MDVGRAQRKLSQDSKSLLSKFDATRGYRHHFQQLCFSFYTALFHTLCSKICFLPVVIALAFQQTTYHYFQPMEMTVTVTVRQTGFLPLVTAQTGYSWPGDRDARFSSLVLEGSTRINLQRVAVDWIALTRGELH